jgi:flagellar motor switch protein FliG
MSESLDELSPAHRCAVLLMAMGTDRAADVMRHMDPRQVQAVGSAMSDLEEITQEQLSTVLDGFIETVRDTSSLNVGSDEFLRTVLSQALGPERANTVLPRILPSGKSKAVESLHWMGVRDIAEILSREHPQIVALALINLDPETAGEVLTLLPEQMRGDVVMRVAVLDGVHPAALKELDTILEGQLGASVELKVAGMGGVQAAADILNTVGSEIEEGVLEHVAQADGELKEEIQERMFDFESLNNLDDRGIQAVLREVSSDTLVLALKGGSTGLRERVFKNMSGRAAEMLREDMESRGPVRLVEVETAQKEIIAVVDRLVEEGTVVMQGKGDDFV